MNRVVFIAHSSSLHGAEQVMLTTIRVARQAGCAVWAVLPSHAPDEGLRDALSEQIGTDCILRLPYRSAGKGLLRTLLVRFFNMPAAWRLSRWCRTNGIDTVFSDTSVTILGITAARMAGIRHLWHFHEPPAAFYGWQPSMRGIYRRCLAYDRNRVIFIARAQQQAWQQELGIPIAGEVIYNPIAPIPQRAKEAHEGIRIGYLGSFEPRKNVGLLLNTFEQLHRLYPATSLWLCGAKDEAEREAWQARTTLPESMVQVSLHTGNVAAFYAAIDILVLPSESETMPLVAVEAMQAGVCVVQTTHSYLSELYTADRDCLFVNPNDPAGWLTALQRCMDAATRERLARQGQTTTLQRDYNNLYTNLMSQILCE